MNLVELKNISKVYKRKDGSTFTVLKNINLSIKKGETLAIIGPNGSGKTTLLKILGLIENSSSGEIYFSEKKITNLKKKERITYRRKYSFVRQKPVVLKASVANNIAYGLRIRGESKETIYQKVEDILNRVNLRHLANSSARTLSGGEKQRAVIAMNFVLNSELYLLDEVTANLDPQNLILFEEFLNEIKTDKEKTIIISTHDPMEATKFADRIAVLINGEISQIGRPNEIFISPKDEFTAVFVGYNNILTGNAHIDQPTGLNQIKVGDLVITASEKKEGLVKVAIHPESIMIAKTAPKQTSFRNTFQGNVINIKNLGNICQIFINCSDQTFLSTITTLSCVNLELKKDSEVYISFKATDVKLL